jgi:UDP-N-acetylglucosamine--N-acetylmuramyl-(pentapeptide) pyrophosphoryl-undecaprenol N-acetylglucosamine transferase
MSEGGKKVKLSYLGSHHGMERDLVGRAKIHFESVSTGKLRRYFSLENFVDAFRVPFGIVQAWSKIGRLKPDVVFSKGGFVGVPVVIGAWLRGVPVVIHESDAIVGLTTKLTARFASKILLGYESATLELQKYEDKVELIGNPVRAEILNGDAKAGMALTGFDGEKPVLLVMGGSSGAEQINQIVKREQEALGEMFDVIHITGKGKAKVCEDDRCFTAPFLHKEMADVYALASLALTRAGANTLAELEALQLPALLYPLGRDASRGDQIANAEEMAKRYEIFKIADPEKDAHAQLMMFPDRPKKQQPNNVTEKIASLLLGFAST